MSDKREKETILFTEEEIKEIDGAKQRLRDKGFEGSKLMSPEDLKGMMSEVNSMRADVSSMFLQAQELMASIQPTIDKLEKKE